MVLELVPKDDPWLKLELELEILDDLLKLKIN